MSKQNHGSSGHSDSIQEVMEANTASKAAGQHLLSQLPWQQKMQARLRSLTLLCIIAAAFWPTFWSVVAICAAYHAWNWGIAAWGAWSQSGHVHSSSQQGMHAGKLGSRLSAAGWLEGSKPFDAQQQQQQQNGGTIPVSYPAANQAAGEGRSVQQPVPVGTAIVTGGKMTKALFVCRALKAAGWRVVLVETYKYWHVGSRLSNAVDVFARVPIPELYPDNYKQAIADVAKREGASLFIPVSSPIASLYDALAGEALPKGCRSWTLSPDMTALLDNKARFSDYAASLGLKVPQHHVVSSPEQLRAINNDPKVLQGKPFILKSLAYDSVHRADLFKLPCAPSQLEAYLARPDITISTKQPWILQEFLKGKEYSCYTLADQGRVIAHADTAAELSNLNYKYEAHPGIRLWVEQFVTRSGVSGQLCFDFIESAADGQLYSIECNPRTSTVITEFHDNPELATGFTNPSSVRHTILPLPGSRPTYWWFNEVARLVTNPSYLWRFLVVVSSGIDAVFDATDPVPFLGLHFVQIPMLLLSNVIKGNPWTKVDVNIGKIAELYGD